VPEIGIICRLSAHAGRAHDVGPTSSTTAPATKLSRDASPARGWPNRSRWPALQLHHDLEPPACALDGQAVASVGAQEGPGFVEREPACRSSLDLEDDVAVNGPGRELKAVAVAALAEVAQLRGSGPAKSFSIKGRVF
jgi:hypothetical protein